MKRSGSLAGWWRLLALGLLAWLIGPVAARERVEATARHAVTGVLPNGLRYYIEPMPSASGIRMTMLVNGGTFDAVPETDAAHVVEHLVANDAMKTVSAWGGAAGRDVNANTGAHSTSYYLDLPAENVAAREVAFSILLRWASPQSFSDEAIDREIKATIEEARGTSPSAARLFYLNRLDWFGDHPVLSYKDNPSGTSNATPQSIRAFHTRWYRPPQLAIVIAGNIDPRAAEREIRARFSTLVSGGPANVHRPIAFHLTGANHYRSVLIAGDAATSIDLTYKRPLPRSYEARLEETVVARFAVPLLDRWTAKFKEKYSPVVLGGGFLPNFDAYGRPAGLTFTRGQFEIRDGAAAEAAKEIFRLIERVRQSGFGKAEIEKVRTALLAEEPDPDTPARAAARWASVFLENEVALDSAHLAATTRRISAERINHILSGWFAPRNRDIVFSGSSGSASLPSEATTDQLLAYAKAHPAPPFEDLPPRTPDLPALLTGSSATGSPVTQEGFLRWRLPASGATLLYRRIDGAGDVRIEALRPGGFRSLHPSDRASAIAAADVVPNSGLGGSDRFELARYLAVEGMAVEPFVTDTREGFRARGPARSLDRLLGLARASLFNPDCRPAAFEDYRLRQIEQRRGGASGDASSALSALVASRLDLPQALDESSLEKLDLKSVCAAYRSIFSDMRDFTIVVEGDLEPEALAAAVGAYLDIPASTPVRQAREAAVNESRAGRDTVLAGEGSLSTVQLVVQRKLSGDGAFDGVAKIANRLLKDRLTARLRGLEKGTYAVAVQTVETARPHRAYVAIQFDCDVANVERLIAAAHDELEALRTKGASPEEIGAAKAIVGPVLPPTIRDIAEAWIAQGSLTQRPYSGDGAVNAWLARYLDATLVHEFVRLPTATTPKD